MDILPAFLSPSLFYFVSTNTLFLLGRGPLVVLLKTGRFVYMHTLLPSCLSVLMSSLSFVEWQFSGFFIETAKRLKVVHCHIKTLP